VLAGASDPQGPPAQALGIVVTTLTYDDGKALMNKNNVRHAEAFAAYVSGNDVLRWQSTERSVTYTGTTPGYEQLENVTFASGRFFTEDELESRAHVMVLGSEIAQELFGNQNPVGQNVKLKQKQFRVIGVAEPQGNSVFEDPDKAVLIPLATAQYELLGIRHVSFIRLKVDDENNVEETVAEIKQTLLERHEEEDFSVRTVAELLSILTTITDVIRFFLIAVASVSLFVGGVGIMNIMLIAVKEKTQEIGLRKAVGATNGHIMRQFLVETMVVSGIAGVIGIVFGVVIAYGVAVVVQKLGYDYSFVVTTWSLLAGCIVSLSIGFIFGLLPARTAAKLNPMEALRYE